MSQPAVTPSGQTGTVDTAGLAVTLATIAQQQTAITSDMSAMRTDVARVATKVDAIETARADFEARLRVIEQRPSTVDLEGRTRALERFRYTVGGLALAGGALAGWAGQWAAQHVH